MGHGGDVSQIDETVGEQTQGPAGEAGGGLAASQGDQVGLLVAIQLALVESVRFGRTEGDVQARLDERLPHPVDCGEADIESLTDLVVGPSGSKVGGIGFEEDSRA